MRQSTNRKDGDIKKRRERNRQAQHEFRQRRQAAEEAQRRRIQKLEDTIEEMANIFIGFCDKIIEMKETVRQPKLMAQLQRSTAQVLLLARSIGSIDEDGTTREVSNERDSERLKYVSQISQAGQGIANTNSSQASSCDRPPHQTATLVESANGDASSTSNIETWDLRTTQLSSGADAIEALTEQAWPQPQHGLGASFFSLQLVEVTISQACLYLNGDLYIPEEHLERAFGFSLRFRSREQLLADLRWLLGPGKNEMHQATGINWNTTYDRRPTSNLGPLWQSSVDGIYGGSGTSTASEHSSDEDLQPEFLTALGVQEQLESLGAKVLGADTLELSIKRHELFETNLTNSASTLGAPQPVLAPNRMGSAALIVQLSTSLLAANLAYVAMCLDKGPVYPRREIARAVEASVILAHEG